MQKILLIEDDRTLGQNLKERLESEGFSVEWKMTLAEAAEVSLKQIQLILLDWMLPDGQGIDFLKHKEKIPTIMLTARADLVDKVLGLESGARDYVTKPFEFRELLARIRVQLRKDFSLESPEVHFDYLRINPIKREVMYKDESISLTKMEFDLLFLLASNPDQIFSREKLLDEVWGYDNFPTTRTVDTHVLQIRQKLDNALIETIRGVGYKFKLANVKKT